MNAVVLTVLFLLPQQDPERLLERLRDDSPKVREEATRILRAMEEAALPALRLTLQDPDAEIRARVRALIDRIEWDAVMDPALLAR
ncbi:MAG: hypothetical protein EHM91_05760, partial [Planctomycetota bacterium]